MLFNYRFMHGIKQLSRQSVSAIKRWHFFISNFIQLKVSIHWRNPFGYITSFLIEYVLILTLFTIVCQTSCIIGTSWMLISLSIDIANDFLMVDSSRLEVTKRFTQIIDLHTDAKKLSECLIFLYIQLMFKCWCY